MKASKKEALTQFHRQNILEASKVLFLEKGFTKTTMEDIAKSSEYSKATLYVYFKSKEEILSYLTLESMELLYSHIHHSLSQNSDLFVRYKEICYALVHYYEASPLYFDITLSNINVDLENPQTPSIFKDIYEVGERINRDIARLLQEGIDSGLLQETLLIRPTIFWFWGSLSGIIKLAYQKTEFIAQSMDLTKEAFLDYSFKRLLQSVLKEGVCNVY